MPRRPHRPLKRLLKVRHHPPLHHLGQHITDGTLCLTCWMTYAQIEKLRTEKVMFKDLQ